MARVPNALPNRSFEYHIFMRYTRRRMPIETHENCAVLFADMSGSTKLYLAVGDDRARDIVAKTLERWSQLTVADGGQVIQLRGH